ncbi:uncharacterized protein LOC110990589 isoform X2 [Acanthaster planci]|uniref:Uncharacterized protein LOC110990589 isoform X2 n=1 Tax=Acanthaster planci TaxID=133434 RepID=A0A8B8A5W4_ACAPL|nr:uncharacterized protein LOC110990589 isoform X2 [Acanthaster planci]
MKSFVLVLMVTVFSCQRACGQAATAAPKKSFLPPPPPPPPNNPPSFRDSKDGDTTIAPTVDLGDPIQELIDEGGVELIIDIEFSSFGADSEAMFKTTMSEASNRYCKTKGNCDGSYKDTRPSDVMVYGKKAATKPRRTLVSFYIKSPYSTTQLTMTSAQLQNMFTAERKAIESSLGYRLDLGDLEFEPFSNGLLLDSWIIALICVVGLFIIVFTFVGCVHYRNKKTDTKMTFEDLEMNNMENTEEKNKVLPPGPAVPASSLKKPKVDVSTNVYQADILSETKTVFVNPSMEKQEDSSPNDAEPCGSLNAIVVTADVSSSNEGSSHSSDLAPPDYEQATKEDAKVIEGPGAEAAGTSVEVSPDAVEDLPPPPPPTAEASESASSASEDLPPPPPPQEEPAASSGASSRRESSSSSNQSEEDAGPPRKDSDAATTPPRKDSIASSTHSSAKGSSSAGKEEAEVVGELENLIADQSKEIAEDQGLDNRGFETTVNEEGEPMTEL